MGWGGGGWGGGQVGGGTQVKHHHHSGHFSSVQDGICALRKAHIYMLHPYLRSVPSVAFEASL